MQETDRPLLKRSVTIAGHATSISLEPLFWEALRVIAQGRNLRIGQLIERIDSQRPGNLSSALRVFVLTAVLEGEIKMEGGVLTASPAP